MDAVHLGEFDLNSIWVASIILLSVLFISASYWLFKPLNRIRDLCDIGYEDHTRNDKYGRTRRQVANEVRQRKKVSEIPPVYPNGWFVLCESDDIKVGQVRAIDALGENFAVFRTADGVACILDAYCPHLGAHLGIGGRVVGDCVECPFHGWQFRGSDGECTKIPYTTGKIPQIAHTKSWICDEVSGFIFVWYHAEGDEPNWKVPRIPEVTGNQWFYRGRSEYRVNAHIQEIPENGSDIAHLSCLHGPSMLYGSDLSVVFRGKSDTGVAPFLQHHWTVNWEPDKNEKHVAISRLHHELRLFNRLSLITVDVEAKQIGPGLVYLTFDSIFGRCVMIETVTPYEPMVQRVLHRLYGPTTMIAPIANFFIWGEAVMFERDVVIWNNKTFINKPVLVSEDRAITHFRRWFQQFYSENSKRFSFQQHDGKNLEW